VSDARAALLRWIPAIGVMAVIFMLSSISGLRVSDDADVDRPARVLGHLGSYALLGGLLLFAVAGFTRPRAGHVLLAVALAILYGLTDELHQALVPERTGQIEDLLVDALGAGFGVGVAYVVLSHLDRAVRAD
jgi:VanZ family protein